MDTPKTTKPFYKRWWVWVLGVFVLFALIGSSGGSKQAPPQTQAQTAPQKQITYQIVDRWTIPNGGEGKVIVISPDLLNETDMVALGDKLKSDVANDRNAFISIFDDASAAALRDKVLAQKGTPAEQDLYDKHFVGEYDKNANTGYHQYTIYFDGVMGTNQKVITY